MNFGEKLKSYRKKFHLTQEELASQLKTSQSAIHLYEEGKRKPSTTMVAKVARFMHMSAYELAEIVKDTEFVKEPDVDYGLSEDDEMEHAFEFMERYLDREEKLFIAQIIFELIRNKNIVLPYRMDKGCERDH